MRLTPWPCWNPSSCPQGVLTWYRSMAWPMLRMVRPVTVPVGRWRDRDISARCPGKGRKILMAHMHFKRAVYKSGAGKASGRVTYITRDTAREPQSVAERQVRYVARADREDLLYTRSRNLPAWAEGNPHAYFRTAEQHEWARGNAFEEWKIT